MRVDFQVRLSYNKRNENKDKDDEASVKTIYSHYDEEGFDESDYEELVGVLELFSPAG